MRVVTDPGAEAGTLPYIFCGISPAHAALHELALQACTTFCQIMCNRGILQGQQTLTDDGCTQCPCATVLT